MSHRDVVVAGGGVIGCAVAWSLARDGRSVVLFERDRIAAHASRVAAGMLVPRMEAAWPGDPLAELGARSLDLFPEWIDALVRQGAPDPGFEPTGSLRVARSRAEADALRQRGERFRDRGVHWLDAAQARAREPMLNPDVCGGLWVPGEGHVESGPLTRALAHAAGALGVRIEEDCPVTAILRDGDRARGVRTSRGDWSADWVVIATGPWAGAGGGGPELPWTPPVTPLRGQLLVLDPPQPVLSGLVSDGAVYLVPRRDGRLLVGATEERVGFECRVTDTAIAELSAAASDLVPGLARAALREVRAGLRPATPDGLPLIGPVEGLAGVLWAVGHHRNGVLLAPLTGRWIADRVAGKAPPAEARAFDPTRFRSSLA